MKTEKKSGGVDKVTQFVAFLTVAIIFIVSTNLMAACPKTKEHNQACLTEGLKSCGGTNVIKEVCGPREDISSSDGPFGCATSSSNEECLPGTSAQQQRCWTKKNCFWKNNQEGCLKGNLLLDFSDSVIKVSPACSS